MNKRLVKVDKLWYAQLLGYLQPEERWVDGVELRPNIILYASGGMISQDVKLVFTVEEDAQDES